MAKILISTEDVKKMKKRYGEYHCKECDGHGVMPNGENCEKCLYGTTSDMLFRFFYDCEFDIEADDIPNDEWTESYFNHARVTCPHCGAYFSIKRGYEESDKKAKEKQ